MSKKFWWEDSVDITVSPTDCISHISTRMLEKELIERMEDKIKDPDLFKSDEKKRGGEFSVEINPEDYDLIDKDDITLADFDEGTIIDHLEKSTNYTVVSKTETFGSMDNVISYLQGMSKQKMRDFLCDLLSITRRSSDDEIVKELKTRI